MSEMESKTRTKMPWPTLMRWVGPMLLWLSLSYILVYLLLRSDWILEAMGEEVSPSANALIYSAIISAVFGAIFTFWGYSRQPVQFMPAMIPVGGVRCPVCESVLLSSSSICPYCGTGIEEKEKSF